jgi:hypothetical protein
MICSFLLLPDARYAVVPRRSRYNGSFRENPELQVAFSASWWTERQGVDDLVVNPFHQLRQNDSARRTSPIPQAIFHRFLVQ